jgi:hypothetical protein
LEEFGKLAARYRVASLLDEGKPSVPAPHLPVRQRVGAESS